MKPGRFESDRCKLVGDFVEDGAVPELAEIIREARPAEVEVVRPRVVIEYVEFDDRGERQ